MEIIAKVNENFEPPYAPLCVGLSVLDEKSEGEGLRASRKPKRIRGAVLQYKDGEVEKAGKRALEIADKQLRREEQLRHQEYERRWRAMTGQIINNSVLEESRKESIYPGGGMEIFRNVGPMQPDVWFVISEEAGGEKPVWFKAGEGCSYVLGDLLLDEQRDSVVEQIRQHLSVFDLWRRADKTVPVERSAIFRATNDPDQATHMLVRRCWTSTMGFLDLPTRPSEAVWHESRRSNEGQASSFTQMSWGRDYSIVVMEAGLAKNLLKQEQEARFLAAQREERQKMAAKRYAVRKAVGGGY